MPVAHPINRTTPHINAHPANPVSQRPVSLNCLAPTARWTGVSHLELRLVAGLGIARWLANRRLQLRIDWPTTPMPSHYFGHRVSKFQYDTNALPYLEPAAYPPTLAHLLGNFSWMHFCHSSGSFLLLCHQAFTATTLILITLHDFALYFTGPPGKL